MKSTRAVFIAAAVVAGTAFAQPPGPLEFHARDAKIANAGAVRFETRPDQQNIGIWNHTNAVVSWSAPDLPKGTWRVIVVYSCIALEAGSEFEVNIGSQRASFKVAATGGWTKFKEADLGPVIIRKSGPVQITARVTRIATMYGLNLRAIRLVPEP